MKLALIRHGHALEHQIDEMRVLSELGQNQALEAAHYLRQNNFKTNQIFHSSLQRAIETCHLITSAHFQEAKVSESSKLKPLSPLSFWVNELIGRSENLALVGHNPFMSLLAQELGQMPVALPTGGCIILQRSNEINSWTVISRNF